MGNAKQPDEYTDEEATRRMNEALKRALSTPHKPHDAPAVKPKTRPASKGRVHKGKTGR